MGVKASYGVMGLKSAQPWGCPMPMLHEISIQRRKGSSHPIPPPSPFSYLLFSKLADRNKCAQLIGDILPNDRVDYEIKWVKVNYDIGSHTPCFSLNTVSETCVKTTEYR